MKAWLALLLVLGSGLALGQPPTITMTYRYCSGGNCRSYPVPGGGLPVAPGPSSSYRPPPGVFTGIAGDDRMDKAYQAAVLSAMKEGQSPETQAKMRALAELVEKHGHAGAAAELSREFRAQLQQQLSELGKMQPVLAPPAPTPVAPGAGLPKDLGDPIVGAAQGHDPYAMADAIDRAALEVHGAHPSFKRQWEGALRGSVVDGQGMMRGLPDSPVPVTLASGWTTPGGRRVRRSLEDTLITQSVLEGELRAYCAKSGPAECRQAEAAMADVRARFGEIALAHAIADRLALRGDAAFAPLMQQLEAVTRFVAGVGKGVLKEAVNLAGAAVAILKNPLILSEMAPRVLDAIVHLDRTAEDFWSAAKADWKTLIYGTPEASGEVAGKVTFQLGTFFVGGELVEGTAAALREVSTRGLWYYASKEAAALAVGAGELSAAAGRAIVDTARVLPGTARALWRGARAELEGLKDIVGAATPGFSFVADDLLTRAASLNAPGTARLLRENPWLVRVWPEIVESGRGVEAGGIVKLARTREPIPFPKDGVFARFMHKNYADRALAGEKVPLARDEAFITAAEDVASLPPSRLGERLGLFERDGITPRKDMGDYKLIFFRFKEGTAPRLACPIEISGGRQYGFVPGGYTSGMAREWLLDKNALIDGIIELVEYPRPGGGP